MITITKKESLFLSVYHTVWMLHEAKTARLVITLYRHITDKLPTSYRHITNCRPTVGRLSADCRPTDSLCFGENLSAVCRPTDGRQTANKRPTVGQQSADSRPTVGRQSANRRPTDGRQSTDSRPTGFLGSSSSQLPGRGPNFLWHIDGYDKLKPFGFAIHGCIDGYSRRIMWLEVGMSNNDPTVVARYFVKCVIEMGGTARIVRADCGTENSHVAAIQRFLRNNSDDSFRAEKSFIYGRSVSNQRIEAWWSQLRRGCTDWWMQHFKELQESGCYCDTNVVHVECLRFCYMDILRDELYRAARLWNNHRIRPSVNRESPGGRPDLLFSLPEVSGTREFMIEVDKVDINVSQQLVCDSNSEKLLDCTPEFSDLATLSCMKSTGSCQTHLMKQRICTVL